MNFELWLYAVKRLAQTMDAAKLIFDNMPPTLKSDLLREYDEYNNPDKYKRKRPIIGIVSKPFEKKKGALWQNVGVDDEIRSMVSNCGGVPIAILPTMKQIKYNPKDTINYQVMSQEETDDINKVLKLCEGFILQGGMSSNGYEIYVAKYALKNDIPMLGICSGFNNILRALGADVEVIDKLLDAHCVYDTEYRHEIELFGKFRKLFKADSLEVNSVHSYFAQLGDREIKQLPIEILAKKTDIDDEGNAFDTIEAFAAKNRRFVVAVKWHPEIMSLEHQNILMNEFIARTGT